MTTSPRGPGLRGDVFYTARRSAACGVHDGLGRPVDMRCRIDAEKEKSMPARAFCIGRKTFSQRWKVTPTSDTECLSTEVQTLMNKAIAALLNDPLIF
jgi:hypothetical protein